MSNTEPFDRLAVQLTQLSIEHAQLVAIGGVGPLVADPRLVRHVNEIGKLIRDLQNTAARLPLGVRIFEAVTARLGEERYLIELAKVAETVRPQTRDLSEESGVEFLAWRSTRVPVLRLAELLGRDAPRGPLTKGVLLIVPRHQGGALAVFVDDLLDTQSVLLKELSSDLRDLPGVAGGAVLNDGTAALVIDLAQILEAAA